MAPSHVNGHSVATSTEPVRAETSRTNGFTAATPDAGPAVSARQSFVFEQRMLRQLLVRLGNLPLEIELWDGTVLRGTDRPAQRMRIARRRFLWNLARRPELWFGEGYAEGAIEVDGDFLELSLIHI